VAAQSRRRGRPPAVRRALPRDAARIKGPSADLVEALSLAGLTQERIADLCGVTASSLRGFAKHPGRKCGVEATAQLFRRMVKLAQKSKRIPDVVQVLRIMARLHLPEAAAAFVDQAALRVEGAVFVDAAEPAIPAEAEVVRDAPADPGGQPAGPVGLPARPGAG
jgi:hypothetical protein